MNIESQINRPSIHKYLKELVSVNDEALQEVLLSKPPQAVAIKSKSICISLYEIKLLCECIQRHRVGLSGPYPTAVSLAEKYITN